MRWSKPSLKAIHSLWGQIARGEVTSDAVTGRVRHAMLSAIPVFDDRDQHARVFRQIQTAPNLQALWYARGALMSAIAADQGEMAARAQIDSITRLFEGHLAESRTDRRPHRAP